MTRLSVGCINVPTKVGPRAWSECWREAAERADIFGINEAGAPLAKRTYLRLADEHGYDQFGTRITTNPIYWNAAKYRLVEDSPRKIRLHGPAKGKLARRYPGFNAARYMTEVVLERVDGGPDVAVINLHWVAPGPKVNRIWRARMRLRSLRRLRKRIARHHALGRIVVVIGDTNLRLPFWVCPRWRWLKGRGVDKVGILLPLSLTCTADVDVFDAPTDHKHGVAVDVDITRKAVR